MPNIAIRVENLSKEYHLGRAQEQHDTLRDALSASFKRLRQRPSRRANEEDILWALKDVSFEVQRGEVVGIIGRNGAGKSTLLKILSQITEPTRGRAEIHGRVGSLLEVGTGFHPELTGRENIYLNGAILGMRRQEIERQFDEIVAFAEIERFLDTPVKRYSSGMYVRLAFAVAAHLEPEILLVDEVLAVGDAAFQNKCLGKMSAVAKQGRTVLFVSHNMRAVEMLCPRSIWINSGSIADDGSSSRTVDNFVSSMMQSSQAMPLDDRNDRRGSGVIRFKSARFLNDNGEEISQIRMGDPLTVEVTYKVNDQLGEPIVGFLFADRTGSVTLRAYSRESHPGYPQLAEECGIVRCRFQSVPLMHGEYNLHLWIGKERQPADEIERAAILIVLPDDFYGTGVPPASYNGGHFVVPHAWEFAELEP